MRRNLAVDFVGRRRVWFVLSGLLVAVAALSLAVRGLNLSIDFRGGSSFTVSGIKTEVAARQLEGVAAEAGARRVTAQLVREGGRLTGAIVRTEAIEPGTETETAVADALKQAANADNVQVDFVGPTWGDRISRKMAQALVVFLVVVVAYISLRLDFKMSIVALVALFHDLLLTAGAYSLFHFNVSPATVIGLLTILGYSLYDTVIVFDRISERTVRLGGAGARTYGQAVNSSMNEVLWRSINTTITSGLPVAGLLFIGAQALGAATLQDLSLALFVGVLSGAYSSLFIAGPTLALWKEREPKLAEMAAQQRPAPAAAGADDGGQAPAEEEAAPTDRSRSELRPRGYVRGPGKPPRSER